MYDVFHFAVINIRRAPNDLPCKNVTNSSTRRTFEMFRNLLKNLVESDSATTFMIFSHFSVLLQFPNFLLQLLHVSTQSLQVFLKLVDPVCQVVSHKILLSHIEFFWVSSRAHLKRQQKQRPLVEGALKKHKKAPRSQTHIRRKPNILQFLAQLGNLCTNRKKQHQIWISASSTFCSRSEENDRPLNVGEKGRKRGGKVKQRRRPRR